MDCYYCGVPDCSDCGEPPRMLGGRRITGFPLAADATSPGHIDDPYMEEDEES